MSEKKTMELSDYLSLAGLELHAGRAKALEDALAAALERLDQAERRVEALDEIITRRCYRRVPVKENQEMQFLGAHVLSWEPDHCPIGPTVAFVECDNEWLAALKEADSE